MNTAAPFCDHSAGGVCGVCSSTSVGPLPPIIPSTTITIAGGVYVQCHGAVDIWGRCKECGQPVTTTGGAHMRQVGGGHR